MLQQNRVRWTCFIHKERLPDNVRKSKGIYQKLSYTRFGIFQDLCFKLRHTLQTNAILNAGREVTPPASWVKWVINWLVFIRNEIRIS